MTAIVAIAGNTVRQVVRQRLFYNVVLFGVGLVLFSMVVGSLTFGYSQRVVRSIGLSGVVLALDLMAVLAGVTLVHQEIERKTLFVVLTRPVDRWQYVFGRFLGLLLALVTSWVGLVAVFLLTLLGARGTPTGADLAALAAGVPEAAVLAGVGLVISTFSTPTVGTGMALGLWVVASTTDDLLRLTKDDVLLRPIAHVIYYLLPCLDHFDFRELAVYQLPVVPGELLWAYGYGSMYVVVLVALGGMILSRREMV
ncbi:MAG: ABC transporter permease [Deltaproteobacteria bacterium]|nr:ABC transporter permease [Deltaproteobacteria bacterium]